MRRILNYRSFKGSLLEKLESGVITVYHRTGLVNYTTQLNSKDFEGGIFQNLLESYKRKMGFTRQKDFSLETFIQNFKLLNPNFPLDEKGLPILKVGDTVKLMGPEIIAKGFTPGEGAYYGVGLYTCYELEDHISDYNKDGYIDLTDYGPTIVEFEVQNNGKFLILDMNPDNNQAKKVWGGNYGLLDQLRKILGGFYSNFYSKYRSKLDQWDKILKTGEGLEKNIQGFPKTAPIGRELIQFSNILSYLDGISFTGGQDYRVFVVFNTKLMKPIRYSPDDAKTWKPLVSSQFAKYQRVKVAGHEMLQLKFTSEVDKEEQQINLQRKGTVSWLSGLDISQILKDTDKTLRIFSELDIDDQESKKQLRKKIESLMNEPEQKVEVVSQRILKLPTSYEEVISKLNSSEKASNYISNYLYLLIKYFSLDYGFGTKQSVKQKFDKTIEDIIQKGSKYKVSFDLILRMSEFLKAEKIKTLITENSDFNKKFSISTRDQIKEIVYKLDDFTDSNTWFRESLLTKIDDVISKLFEEFKGDRGDFVRTFKTKRRNDTFYNVYSGDAIDKVTTMLTLMNMQFDYGVFKNTPKLAEIFLDNLEHGWRDQDKVFMLKQTIQNFSESYFENGKDFLLLNTLFDKTSRYTDKQIEDLSDCIVVGLAQDKIKDKLVDLKFSGTIMRKVLYKFEKFKKEGSINFLQKQKVDFKESVGKSMQNLIQKSSSDIDHKSIANKIYDCMSGGLFIDYKCILGELSKLKKSLDLELVKSAFGRRKFGWFRGKELSLREALREKLKDRQVDEINAMFNELGITDGKKFLD